MRSAVRLTSRGPAGNRNASGVLTNAALIDAALLTKLSGGECFTEDDLATHVITAAHFLRNADPEKDKIRVGSATVDTTVTSWQVLPGTDIAVGLLAEPAAQCVPPIISSARLRSWHRVVTCGFSGQSKVSVADLVPRYVSGRVISGLPWAISKDLATKARHSALIMPVGLTWARKGDSGGPALRDGKLIGIQSMVAMPFGVSLGFASINLLGPHLPALKAALAEL